MNTNLELKAAIIRKFRTQENFADAMKVCDTQVSKVVRRRRNLSKKEQARWAAALGGDPVQLFADKGLEKCYPVG